MNDESACSSDIHDAIVAQFLCEDAWAERSVAAHVDASKKSNKRHGQPPIRKGTTAGISRYLPADLRLGRESIPNMLAQNPQHSSQRFGRTPQQLIAHGERAEILRAEIQLVQSPYGDIQRSRDGGRREAPHLRFSIVRDDAHTLVFCRQNL